MRNSPWYIAALVVFIVGSAGYVYGTSEVLTLRVTSKHIEESGGRRGSVQLDVLDTDQGAFPLLQFPVIGYASGIDTVYEDVAPGSTVQGRVGHWPPLVLGGTPRRYILSLQ